ncbi:MAG: BMP family ABC transporter substrate-binding protein [Anaerolineales bacterium]|nr:BMP family ABC transporter substrate-binding protein [Anaerolineae bacterium]PWB52420.1 MAG: BMP family ABC transporter substrate-binding protein [Anaerolineales bacterium]
MILISAMIVFVMIFTACQTATTAPVETAAPTTAQTFTFGILMVGPYNDHGWSEAHYAAGKYVEEKLPGAKMIYVDKVNTADRPGTTPAQLAEDLLNQGAQLVIFNSDDMKDSATEFAKNHPDIPVIMASGDQSWKEGEAYVDLPKMVNIMGRMEYGKMMAGCVAALTTKTGKIGYLGPLINDETRRLASSAYLGAKYCWTDYMGKDAAELSFKVTWIGFWFNIPGVTSDPTQVADDFFNSGYDVVISGIDTTEAVAEAKKLTTADKPAWAIPYDYKGSCEEGAEICLGVPYFNWGPSYLKYIKLAVEGNFASAFEWNGPDWSNINNPDTSAVGFEKGAALSAEAGTQLDKFIGELAGGLNLWKGPLNLQDGTAYLNDGEVATDQQVWYLPQLLEGMEGQSVP